MRIAFSRTTPLAPLLLAYVCVDAATLYLGVCGIAGSKEGQWENVNETNESAHPNVGCVTLYKGRGPTKEVTHGLCLSASGVTERACCVLPGANKTYSNDFLRTDK